MTVKEKDGENDSGSNLDRDEIFRVNLDVHKATFRKLFGTIPKRPGKVETVSMQYDFSSTDCILPHPVYVWMGWICSLSPSKKTFGELKLLIQETYDYAREKCAKKKLSFLSIARLETIRQEAVNMISAIYERRSTRKFLTRDISKSDMTDIIQSGMKAPSSKNRQPWKYIVVQGDAKEEMLRVFRQGIEREENEYALLPQSKRYIAAAKHTVDVIEAAPTIVFVVNSLGKNEMEEMTPEEHVYEICNIQSIGASVQNMLLAATEKGIGSLWICDIYFAYSELCEWLNSEGQLIAAIAFGYPDEFPEERPRKRIEEIVEWRS